MDRSPFTRICRNRKLRGPAMRHDSTLASLPLLAILLLAARPASGEDPGPHVLLLFVDDMGWGDLRSFNPESRIPTPNLDRLAAEGVRFTDFHAPGSVCVPSRYGLLTGRYPFRARLDWRREPCIDQKRTTLASFLRENGYHTAMVGKWHLGFHHDGFDQPLRGGPIDRGFDSFFGIPASTDIPPYYYIQGDRAVEAPTERIEASASPGWSPIQGAFWREGLIAPGLKLADVLPDLTDRALGVIRSFSPTADRRRLFLYVAFPSPHTPWLPTEPFRGRSGAGLYGDFVVMVDHMIGRLLRELDAAGLTAETLVIFTSDNGPVWYADDVKRLGHDSLGGLRGMKGDAWEGGHRVPFIARWPERVRPGTASDRLAGHVDLLATLSDILDRALPEGAGEDSFSFLPDLVGTGAGKSEERDGLVAVSSRGVLALRHGPWKLIPALGSGGFSKPARVPPGPGGPTGQLYHLGDDPGEQKNLWLDRPEVVKRLSSRLDELRRRGSRESR